jgi:Calcineurin-like phosphoesterase
MRTFVMGDPQAPFAKVLDVLDRHGALVGKHLADDVTLVSIGDHFDYDHRDPATAGREGLQLLRWLADHERERVHILFGNHDAARVMELATIGDDEFAAARAFAVEVDAGTRSAAEFRGAFPELPPHGVLGRDYASFSVAQRTLVMEMLLGGRFRIALVGHLDGREVLVTHAGVTMREVEMLGVAPEPTAIADALERHFAAAIARVRPDWQRGATMPLSLEPLHFAGGAGEEGGGLLYHRPSNPTSGSAFHPTRPRRFDPRTLPPGLAQIAGHSGHAKCIAELGAWVTDAARARAHGGIRTLRVLGGSGAGSEPQVVYDLGVAPPDVSSGAASLIMIDGELRRVPAEEVALLSLGDGVH